MPIRSVVEVSAVATSAVARHACAPTAGMVAGRDDAGDPVSPARTESLGGAAL